jgi:hypothetical protein
MVSMRRHRPVEPALGGYVGDHRGVDGAGASFITGVALLVDGGQLA